MYNLNYGCGIFRNIKLILFSVTLSTVVSGASYIFGGDKTAGE